MAQGHVLDDGRVSVEEGLHVAEEEGAVERVDITDLCAAGELLWIGVPSGLDDGISRNTSALSLSLTV